MARQQIGWLPEHEVEFFDDDDPFGPSIEPMSAVNPGDRYSLNGGPEGQYGYLPVFVEVDA